MNLYMDLTELTGVYQRNILSSDEQYEISGY